MKNDKSRKYSTLFPDNRNKILIIWLPMSIKCINRYKCLLFVVELVGFVFGTSVLLLYSFFLSTPCKTLWTMKQIYCYQFCCKSSKMPKSYRFNYLILIFSSIVSIYMFFICGLNRGKMLRTYILSGLH